MQTMNHRITLKSLLAATALTMAFGTAVAANEAVDEDATTTTVAQTSLFSQLDVNKDKVIDQKETSASAKIAQSFDDADVNKDGKLSTDEFNAAFGKSGSYPHAWPGHCPGLNTQDNKG